MARAGEKVMQFLSEGRYVAAAVGTVNPNGRRVSYFFLQSNFCPAVGLDCPNYVQLCICRLADERAGNRWARAASLCAIAQGIICWTN